MKEKVRQDTRRSHQDEVIGKHC